jgi:hypothetical protein
MAKNEDIEQQFNKIYKIVGWLQRFLTMVQRDDPDMYEEALKGERYAFALQKLVQQVYNHITKKSPFPIAGGGSVDPFVAELERIWKLDEKLKDDEDGSTNS